MRGRTESAKRLRRVIVCSECVIGVVIGTEQPSTGRLLLLVILAKCTKASRSRLLLLLLLLLILLAKCTKGAATGVVRLTKGASRRTASKGAKSTTGILCRLGRTESTTRSCRLRLTESRRAEATGRRRLATLLIILPPQLLHTNQ